MFSHLGRDGFEARKANYENLMDVAPARRPGRAVAGQPVGLQGRVRPRAERGDLSLKHPTLCPAASAWTAIMLDGLDARIAALPGGAARAACWW
jgi:lipid A ethanolaminephosphotransferase